MATLLLATLGGASTGTFPIFIKTKDVLAADVHPVIFQVYKSACVCIAGIALVFVRWCTGENHTWVFTWWAAASAAAWIPAGICTIVSVPLIGVGSCVLTTSAVSAGLSFFVFWLGFHSPVKKYEVLGHEDVVLAPVYLVGCLMGMAGLVKAQQAATEATAQVRRAAAAAKREVDGSLADLAAEQQVFSAAERGDDALPFLPVSGGGDRGEGGNPLVLNGAEGGRDGERLIRRGVSLRSPGSPAGGDGGSAQANAWGGLRMAAGFVAAALTGFFSALQFGLVTYGSEDVAGRDGGDGGGGDDDEAFDALGSWLASFGVAALLLTGLVYLGLGLHQRFAQDPPLPPPSLHLRVMMVPGAAAGFFWTLGNVLTVLAVQQGGNATVIAQVGLAGRGGVRGS